MDNNKLKESQKSMTLRELIIDICEDSEMSDMEKLIKFGDLKISLMAVFFAMMDHYK